MNACANLGTLILTTGFLCCLWAVLAYATVDVISMERQLKQARRRAEELERRIGW